MGRTVRHFTGRLDLWSHKLQKAVEDQLRPQLWKIATINEDEITIISKHDDTLVPISIRLMIDRLVIHENILWDKNLLLSPFEFAQDLANEMNLPDEAVIAIAMTIIEQIHGLSIDTALDPTLVNNVNKSCRGAWTMDLKENASITSQVVAQHRSI